MKVYLSGTIKTNWRDQITKEAPEVTYFDPSTHGLTDPAKYTNWNLNHIAEADVILAYMGQETTLGVGMATEVGFARGLNKRIILIDLKNHPSCEYLRTIATAVATSMPDGINFLKDALRWIR